ncbi:site-specific integrase [Adlercreutzia sp. ZJ473]|uniref:site-specific integrase n=1 Tax=Adlercreutzia sp. ZJ473 TaxID=2722822 RepID=UPI001553783C|nr:site-specific integrase [Adlercreutzia sp. ZJ473]
MSANQEKNGTWTSQFRYEDIYGTIKHKCKRGFATCEDAEAFEDEFLRRARGSLDMRFADFADVYAEDVRPLLRENTWATKEYIINDKIIPFFGTMRVRDITTLDIIEWQNELLEFRKQDAQPYTETYVRTVWNQLAAILNHAERYYGLAPNPAAKAPKIGSKHAREVNVWTKEQYLKFSETLADYPAVFVPVEVLYWMGLRLSELLALTPRDIDFERCELYVRHSYKRLKGKDIVTSPKTEKSTRKLAMPEFLRDEIKDYVRKVSKTSPGERIFEGISATDIRVALDDGIEELGLPRIRIHDLRHSHVSLLIDLGYSAVAIGERLGHESTEITFRYAHMFPDAQSKMADALESYRGDGRAL